MRHRFFLAPTLTIAICLPAQLAAQPLQFVIEVAGTPGMRYIGNCSLEGAPGGERYVEFDGTVPDALAAAAVRLSCVVQKHDSFGRLQVTLLQENQPIAFAETAAPFNWVQVWSKGDDGLPNARRGAVPAIRVDPPAGARPPRPTAVPPHRDGELPPSLDLRKTTPR